MTEPAGSGATARADLDRWARLLVTRARAELGVEIASVAMVDESGGFRMEVHDGARTDGYRALRIEPGAGLGGLVATLGRPMRIPDYGSSARITADYRDVVVGEGLRGIACVPVRGAHGIELLLYAGNRTEGNLDDRALGRLEGLAAAAESDLVRATMRARENAYADQTRESIAAAVRAERQRIAQDLHDSVAQVLFAISVDAGEAGALRPEEVSDRLSEIASLAHAGRLDLRRTFADLTADPLEGAAGDAPLGARLAGIVADAVADGLRARWIGAAPESVAWAGSTVHNRLVVDTLGEALRNVHKHGSRPEALLRWGTGTEATGLVVQNPTAGPVGPLGAEPGSGLALLAGRAHACGGSLSGEVHEEDGERWAVLRLLLPGPTAADRAGARP